MFYPTPQLPLSLLIAFVVLLPGTQAETSDQAGKPTLQTRWTAEVTPENVWQEYPRPQLRRGDWMNLNGHWELEIASSDASPSEEFSQEILVPFPVESFLSGVMARPTANQTIWYRRKFELPDGWEGKRIWLHFGAVDWSTEVVVNGITVGSHQGGYDPFSFDITDAVEPQGENVLTVAVTDPTDRGFQPRGKQKERPEGIWYTPVSGIWQTVWLEPTSRASLRNMRIDSQVEQGSITITPQIDEPDQVDRIELIASREGEPVASGTFSTDEAITLQIPDALLWSPDEPNLYDLQLKLHSGDRVLDEVESYFAIRSITIGNDANGLTRILLNGKPVFQYGPLDQGYWPDGLYTPPSDEAMRYDLETIKRVGFNMVRKHVKVEPARWYYWCDRIGLLVWQDMPNGDSGNPWPEDGVEGVRSPASAAQFRKELKAMIDNLYNFPSVVVWIPFNEAWGQFETEAITDWIKSHDPSRLVISASGGNDFGTGDIKDDHFYPGPGAPPSERHRAAVLGEFGGYGLPLDGHTWQDEANWGYRSFREKSELEAAYLEVLRQLRPLVETHLSAAVYTQLTDVEIEVNGLLTYDREVLKVDERVLQKAHQELLASPSDVSHDRIQLASTLAWWTFEGSEPGTRLPNFSDRLEVRAANDKSGRNNHLYAFSSASAPSAIAIDEVLDGKADSRLGRVCLDDREPPGVGAPVRDLFTEPNLSRTHMDVIDNYAFSEWTIEASFAVTEVGRTQVVLAKQNNPGKTSDPPLQVGVFVDSETGESHLELHMIDRGGESHVVKSNTPVHAARWYHVAATCDGSRVRLYLRTDQDTEFKLEMETPVNGALYRSNGTWIVGRGFENNEMAHDYVGFIDEIRISTLARPVADFLLAP